MLERAGHAAAEYNLGVLYLEGQGVPKDAIKAAALIGAAADKGNPDAMMDYGVLVFRGEGVQQNEKIGAQWLILAAKRGNPIAQNRAARLYLFGKGVAADPVEALKWNILANKAGRADAELWLSWDALPPQMTVEQRLSHLTRWVLEADTRGMAYGLRLPGATLPLAGGPSHRAECLRALALHGTATDHA